MLGTATHYGLNVSDMETALSFYRDELGCTVTRRFPISAVQGDIIGVNGVEGEIAFLDANGFEIELIAYEAPRTKTAMRLPLPTMSAFPTSVWQWTISTRATTGSGPIDSSANHSR